MDTLNFIDVRMDPVIISNFVSITGSTQQIALQYLEIANNNLENALELYYDQCKLPSQSIKNDAYDLDRYLYYSVYLHNELT